MLRRILFITAAFVFFFSTALFSQNVDDLVKKNIEARGGYKNIKAIKSIKMTGKYLTGEIEAPFLYKAKRPNFLRIDITVQGQKIIRAYDGKTPWWTFPFQGITEPQPIPEEMAKNFTIKADIDGALVDYKKKGHKIELLGKEDVEGTAAYKLKLTYKNGETVDIFLDAENYLGIKTFVKVTRQGIEYEVDSFSGDYKEVGGVMFPHSQEDKVGGVTREQVVIDEIELNVDMDDAIFKMPAEKEEKKQEEK